MTKRKKYAICLGVFFTIGVILWNKVNTFWGIIGYIIAGVLFAVFHYYTTTLDESDKETFDK